MRTLPSLNTIWIDSNNIMCEITNITETNISFNFLVDVKGSLPIDNFLNNFSEVPNNLELQYICKAHKIINQINKLMKTENINRKQLAKKLKWSKKKLKNILDERKSLDIDTLTKISQAVGYNISVIFYK